jgi:hypothetical protein
MTLSLHFNGASGNPTRAVSVTGTADLSGEALKIIAEIGLSEFWTTGDRYSWGCTRADVTVGLDTGQAREWVSFAPAQVSHKLGRVAKGSWTGELKPELTAEAGKAKIGASLGSVSRSSERETSDQIEYVAEEPTITDVRVQRPEGIKWTFMVPQGLKAYRNWIAGTFNLWSTWGEPSVRSGWVRVRYNMTAFDRNRRSLSGLKKWLMEYKISDEDARAIRDMASADRLWTFRFE